MGWLPRGGDGAVGNEAEGGRGSTKPGVPGRDRNYLFWLF